ncbi:protein-tyrosine phosphatase-like protein [Trametes punicea]|nr:protein-tyrosine phosphatase-like protein [Trametes punicea]
MLSFSSPIAGAALLVAAPQAHSSRRAATIREASMTPSEITSRLYLSGLYTAVDEEQLTAIGVTHIVSVIENRPKYPKTLKGLKTLHVPVEDSEYADILQHLDVTTSFIRSALEDRRNVVLVHCAMGISRSPTVVCAYLIAQRSMTPSQALEFIASKRQIVRPNMGFRRQLDVYAARLYGSKKLRRSHVPIPPPVRMSRGGSMG